MDNLIRGALYLRDRADLTPAQRRRFDKHERVETSPHASIRRASRLRKAWERKLRNQRRNEGRVLVQFIRSGGLGGFIRRRGQ